MPEFLNSVVISAWLFLAGFGTSLRWDRCMSYYLRNPTIFKTTCSCILLNGLVFLGSIKFILWVVRPAVAHILYGSFTLTNKLTKTVGFLDSIFTITWLLPAYIISFFVSCIWYGEIAEATALEAQKQAQQKLVNDAGMVAPAPSNLVQVRKPGAITALSQEIYRSLLFCVLFLLATGAGQLPIIGGILNFLMMSWLYALYCFDYKWNLHGVPLEHRTQALEEQWSYFAGFGAFMILVGKIMPYFEGAAVVAILFPLFIVTAADANPREAYAQARAWCTKRGMKVRFRRVPVFGIAIRISNTILAVGSMLPLILAPGKQSTVPTRAAPRTRSRIRAVEAKY